MTTAKGKIRNQESSHDAHPGRGHLPLHDDPVRGGPGVQRSRAGRGAGCGQEDLPGHPARRQRRRTQGQRNLPGRHDRQHRAEPEAAGWKHQSPGRRHRARQDPAGHRDRRLHAGIRPGGALRHRDTPQIETGMQRVTSPVRAVRKAVPVAELRDHDRRRAHGRSGQADGHHLRQPAAFDRREAGTARDLRSRPSA